MTDGSYVLLEDRGVLALEGEEASGFLNNLVSNDVARAASGTAVHAALLTPQGKYLHDFFVARVDGTLDLDAEAARLDDLTRRLSMYRLRAKVTFVDRTEDLAVAVLFDGVAEGDGIFADPRLPAAGARAILPRSEAVEILEGKGFAAAPREAYDALRLSLGLPDGTRDLVVEESLPLENGFDELNSIDWDKGCFLGQETTNRTKHRAQIKKRLMPVGIDGSVPAPGTPVLLDGEQVGEMRSAVSHIGLALMRLEFLGRSATFTAGQATLSPRKPEWADWE